MRDVRSRVRSRVREKLQKREEKKRARLFIQKRKKIQETSGDSKESPLVLLGISVFRVLSLFFFLEIAIYRNKSFNFALDKTQLFPFSCRFAVSI